MKKLWILALVMMVPFSAQADEGKKVYDEVCSKCHVLKMGWQIEDMSKLSAPPFPGVVRAVRGVFNNEAQFVEFVSTYIQNPTRIRSRVKDAIPQRFGLMPNIGADLTQEQREAVAKWMYHYVGKM